MAKRKVAAKEKSFPKQQGEEGARDRFIPPDRADQIDNDGEDRAQVVNVKDLAADIEILEDDSRAGGDEEPGDEPGEGDEEGTRATRRARPARTAAREEEPLEDDDRDDRYSRRVRARINRERSLRQQSDAKVQHAERRAKQMEDRVAKLERVTTEVNTSNDVRTLEAAIAQLEKDAKAALAADETAKAFEIQAQIGDKKSDLKLLKRDMESARRQQLADEERRKTETAADETDGTQNGVSPVTREWMSANRGWYNRERFKDARTDAGRIDAEILEEISAGDHDFEKYSDEHFDLVNERLADLYPDLPIYNTDGSKYELEEEDVDSRDRDNRGDRRDGRRPQPNTRRAPVGGGGRRNGRHQPTEAELARQGKVALSTEDFTQMRLYGLDPAKAEHKKRFAKERMRSILTQEQRDQRSDRRGARS